MLTSKLRPYAASIPIKTMSSLFQNHQTGICRRIRNQSRKRSGTRTASTMVSSTSQPRPIPARGQIHPGIALAPTSPTLLVV